jgi:hypothetical protein
MPSTKPCRPNRPTKTKPNPVVEAGIEQINQLYALGKDKTGRKSLLPLLQGKTDPTVKEYTEKARRFADSSKGYSAPERRELFAQCREFGFKIGTSHVLILLRVSNHDKRRDLQTEMIQKRWSCRKLSVEIAKKRPKRERRHPGRTGTVPTGVTGAEHLTRQAFEHASKIFIVAVRVVANRQRSEAASEALACLFCEHVVKITSAMLDGDPPLAAVSSGMRSQIKRLRTAATTRSK